jgi:hypothetical protein
MVVAVLAADVPDDSHMPRTTKATAAAVSVSGATSMPILWTSLARYPTRPIM